MIFPYFFPKHVGFKNSGFSLFPGVLDGLGSSGGLVGTISTYPGTYLCPGSRVTAKNNMGIIVNMFMFVPNMLGGKKNWGLLLEFLPLIGVGR